MSFLDYLNKKEQEKIEQKPEKPKKKIDIVEHNEEVEEKQETKKEKPPHPYKETVDYAGYVLEQAENMDYDVRNQRSKDTQANDDLDHAEMLL